MAETIQHKLQQLDPGIVWLDADRVITGMNRVARETLGDQRGRLVGEEVLRIHPGRSREKVRFLLDQAARGQGSPPPVTMMVNIPERVLLVKVSEMLGADETRVGTCMIFYDLTDIASDEATPSDTPMEAGASLRLFKLPVYKNKQVLLVDLDSIACVKADGHYSTLYTRSTTYLCNLALSDLESRIQAPQFVRVHRSYMVNMHFAKAFKKEDDQCYLILETDSGLSVPISRSNVVKMKSLLGLA